MMQESATLNVGQWVRVMKSTTGPVVPAEGPVGEVAERPAEDESEADAPPPCWVRQATTDQQGDEHDRPTSAITAAGPVKRLNAAPELKARARPNGPSTCTGRWRSATASGLGHLVERRRRPAATTESDAQHATGRVGRTVTAAGRPGSAPGQRRDSPPLLQATHSRA